MLIRRLVLRLRQKDWSSLLAELLVVMLGIVAAFQVDRWWEARGDRIDEGRYVERLIGDLQEDVPALEHAIALAQVRLAFTDHLVAVAASPALAEERPAYFLAAVAQAAYTFTPSLASQTFDDLRATGNLRLIRDAGIRDALRVYYGFDQGQRQFLELNLGVEARYFELSAGVASFDQHRYLQERWYVVHQGNLAELEEAEPDLAAVRAAAERLRTDAELLDWLPRVRGLQLDQAQMNGYRLERARSLLERLQAWPGRQGE